MKKLFFSFVMLVTLVIVAGSAMGQDKKNPYQGGTYDYTVSGILVQTQGTAKIEYLGGSGASFSNVNLADAGSGLYTVPTGGTALTFKTTYSSSATAGKIRVTITDGSGTGSCVNFIEMSINPKALPLYAVTVTTSNSEFCQNTTSTPADVTAASVGQTNTVTFTVKSSVLNLASTSNYSYTYTVDLTGTGLDAYGVVKTSGNGTCTPSGSSAFVVNGSMTDGSASIPDQVFTITFKTTTGKAPIIIPGTLVSASITVPDAGNKVYNASPTTAAPSKVNTMPSIGTFN